MRRSQQRPGIQAATRRERLELDRALVSLKLIAEGFTNPVALTDPMDGSGRLFVLDQIGKVYALRKDQPKAKEVALDVRDRVVEIDPKYDERGLLGLAFHPQFKSNGKFYLYYSAPLRDGAPSGWDCTNYLAEFRAPGGDFGEVDLGSERRILAIDKPQYNHNGGHIAFGPDGFLYIPLGDGGGADDKDEGHTIGMGNAQDTNKLLGKILRIDIDRKEGNKEYGIPQDNPFINGGGLPEIFAYGVRNPYHISFDSGGEHQLFAANAGQNRWEEVDIVVKGGNYGWNLKEGRHWFNPKDDMNAYVGRESVGFQGEKLIDPIIEYPNLANRTGGIGSVVIGGYVYRGSAIPFLTGRYIFGDWNGKSEGISGRLFVASPPSQTGDGWVLDELSVGKRKGLEEYVLAFGEDAEKELYLLSNSSGPKGNNGHVYKIVPA